LEDIVNKITVNGVELSKDLNNSNDNRSYSNNSILTYLFNKYTSENEKLTIYENYFPNFLDVELEFMQQVTSFDPEQRYNDGNEGVKDVREIVPPVHNEGSYVNVINTFDVDVGVSGYESISDMRAILNPEKMHYDEYVSPILNTNMQLSYFDISVHNWSILSAFNKHDKFIRIFEIENSDYPSMDRLKLSLFSKDNKLRTGNRSMRIFLDPKYVPSPA
jgi:hypothetical protein